MKDLTSFFSPKSIGVIGASREPSKLGNQLVKNLLNGYKGRIYPINPKADTIYDLKCYPQINKLHEIPSLVMISVPTSLVYDSVKASIEFGVNNFVIITAGFKEIGLDGKLDEDKLAMLIHSYPNREINVLGPNCLGLLNTHDSLNASFASSFPIAGKAKFISQSGALCSAVLDWSQNTLVGFSDFVSMGNKMDINENDLLEYWYDQSIAQKEFIFTPIFAYIEAFSSGIEFMEIARKITKRFPLVVLKPGKFEETKSAMSSHTGSLASDDRITEQALKQCGVTRVEGLQDLYDLMMAFDWSVLPKGKNVAIVSNAGGPGIITTDFIKQYGLDIAHFSAETSRKLQDKLPRTANIHDPVDVIGDALADRYGMALEIVLAEEQVDSVIVLLTPQAMTQIRLTAQLIAKLSKSYKKTIVASFMGGKKVNEAQEVLTNAKIPFFAYPERAVYAISKMYEYAQYKLSVNCKLEDLGGEFTSIPSTFAKPLLTKFCSNLKANDQEYLYANDAEQILKIYAIPCAKSITALSKDDAIRFSHDENSAIALKLSSPYLVHKSDVGAVILNLKDDSQIENAFNTIFSNGMSIAHEHPLKETFRVQAQKMSDIKYELIIGAKRDPTFGNIILFGMGGIYAEIYKDTSMRIAPLNKNDAIQMINETKISKMLNGARNGQVEDINTIAKILTNLSIMMDDNKDILEIDLNPVVITKEGQVLVLDAKIKI